MGIENKRLKRQHARWQPKSPRDIVIRLKTERRGIGKLKAMSILFVALLQLGVLITLHTLVAAAFRGYLIFSVVMDILTCLYVLASDKNGRSKAVWIMLILVLFPVGFLIFFLSDERIFFRSSRRRYRAILQSSSGMLTGCSCKDMPETTARACTYIKNATGYVPYKNTSAEYFPSGAGAFDDMIERCASAEKFIFLEYFIVAGGMLFDRLFSVLKERAAAGVDVRVIYDDMGSSGKLSGKLKREVRASGIQLYAFNKLVPMYKIAMNYRDHRKITVIDGRFAYTGGINISDEYVNERRLYGYWKDNAVRIEGDAVQGFTLMFLRQWEFVTKKPSDYSPFMYAGGGKFPEPVSSGDVCGASGGTFLPYASGLEYAAPVARDVYAGAISQAGERLWIMTPYFVPDDTITNMLASKALSGVDVRIVLPGVPDKAYVYLISLDNADKLMSSGVKVYTMTDAFVHTKSVLTEKCAIIGSANFDLRSFFQQYENALYTDDAGVMRGLEQDFLQTFPECTQRNYASVQPGPVRSLLISLLQIFSPLM